MRLRFVASYYVLRRVAALSVVAVAIATGTHAVHAQETQEITRLVRSGQTEQAMQRLDAALAANPKDAQLRFLKGVLLSDQKRSTEAIQVFVSLTEDYPELAEPWNNLAVLYAGEGRYDKARAALELAIKTQPNYAIAHENLGDVYLKLATQSYERAISLDITNLQAKRKLSIARELLGSSTPTPALVEPPKTPAATPAAKR
ncbi:MAG TPA: tetratricopeptide repeat protein [Burkholderiaceae bacterium]|nr:tetratricopeptide repeat protein [Burkholderiaceae bacterium]